jgi:hypothetical protein
MYLGRNTSTPSRESPVSLLGLRYERKDIDLLADTSALFETGRFVAPETDLLKGQVDKLTISFSAGQFLLLLGER